MKKLIPLAVLLILSGLQLFAQEGKLKTVQAGSVWAPAGLKVDGNLKEWDDTFQAYNKTTKLFYTISNDDKYLYFVVKSIDVPNNAKIIAGGITLTINTEDKKKDQNAYNITYPIIPRPARGQRGGGGGGGRGGAGGGGRGVPPDSAAIAAQRKQTIEASKEIRVLGFKDIMDTLISIYNEYSIKAAIGYDPLGNYDYELAVPLKELNLTVDNAKEFAYNVKVNGIEIPAGFGGPGGPGGNGGADAIRGGGAPGGDAVRGGGGAPGGGRAGRGGGGGAPPAPGSARDPEMYAPTDFWGKYTLAKK
jgi:hypothetical protein